MFEKSFTGQVEKVIPRRVKDEDGGAIHLSVLFSMLMDDEHLQELGEEFKAMVDARHKGETTKSVPFTAANLDLKFEELSLVVYGESASDKKPPVKFQVDGCEAKGYKLLRAKDDNSTVELKFRVLIPPLKQRDMHYLIEAVDENVRIALVPTQTSLEV